MSWGVGHMLLILIYSDNYCAFIICYYVKSVGCIGLLRMMQEKISVTML